MMYKKPIFTFILILISAVIGVQNHSVVHARFAELPDLFGLPDGPTSASWPADASATCSSVTVSVSYPQNENPLGIPDVYDSVTWSLEQVLKYDFASQTLVELPSATGEIYTFPVGTSGGETHSVTFDFDNPVPAGTALYVKVRYLVSGGALGGATDVFDIGDFDHPYWLMRAYDQALDGQSNYAHSFFCDAVDVDNAPTVYMLGDVVKPEQNSGHTFSYTAYLDKPSTEDIYLDLKTVNGLNLPGFYQTYPSFNGYSTRGLVYGSGVCLDSGPDCITPDYTTVKIPAGVTSQTFDVTLGGGTAAVRDWFGEQPVEIIRSTNAKLGGQLISEMVTVEDDPCTPNGPECLGTLLVPDSGFALPFDTVNFYVDNIVVNENEQNAVFTVNLLLTNPGDYPLTSLDIYYETTSNGRNSTPGEDYIPTSGTLTFTTTNPQQIVVPIPKDPSDEGLESFGLKLNKMNTYWQDAVEVGALIINDPDYTDVPIITQQPQNDTILVEQSAELSVTATSDLTLSYQWYEGQSGDTSIPIVGATDITYTTPVFAIGEGGNYDYWVRVSNGYNTVDSETATVTVEEQEYLLLAEGFETDADANKLPDGWDVSNMSKDKLKCNKYNEGEDIPYKVFSYSGECAFRFKGVTGERAKIKWVTTTFPTAFGIGDAFGLTTWIDANRDAASRAKIKLVALSDIKEKSKFVIRLGLTEGYVQKSDLVELTNSVTKLKVVIKSRAETGKIYIDDLMLTAYNEYVAPPMMAQGIEAIPLPDVPDGFRR